LNPFCTKLRNSLSAFTSASCSSLHAWLSVCPLHSCWNFLMAGSIFACCSSIRMRSGSAYTLPIPHSSAAAMIIIVVFVFAFMAESSRFCRKFFDLNIRVLCHEQRDRLGDPQQPLTQCCDSRLR